MLVICGAVDDLQAAWPLITLRLRIGLVCRMSEMVFKSYGDLS